MECLAGENFRKLQRWVGNAQEPHLRHFTNTLYPYPKKIRHAEVASRVGKLWNLSLTPKYRAELIPNDFDASGNRLISQFCRHNNWDLVDTCKVHFHVKNKESTVLHTLPNGKIGSKIWGLLVSYHKESSNKHSVGQRTSLSEFFAGWHLRSIHSALPDSLIISLRNKTSWFRAFFKKKKQLMGHSQNDFLLI